MILGGCDWVRDSGTSLSKHIIRDESRLRGNKILDMLPDSTVISDLARASLYDKI